MKRAFPTVIVICLILALTGCGGETAEPSMYIEPARLTEEEENIADLLGVEDDQYIFDFVLDDNVQSMQINTYELADGEWRMIAGGGGQAFDDTAGRIALGFDMIGEGVRIAVQSDGSGGATAYYPDPKDDFEGMGSATSFLSGRTEIVYEAEIPLAVQIVTAKNEIHSYMVEYFHSPEEYAGYEYVYAITARFSQKTVAQLSSEG